MDLSGWEIKFYDFIDKLPFDISLYHPLAVHFAVSLPFIALLFQWASLANSSKGYQNAANLIFLLGALFIVIAFVTGKAAGPDVKPLLPIPGQDLYDQHRDLGTYLTLGYLAIILLKLIATIIKKELLRYMITISMVIALIALAFEIKSGHELVYGFGAGTQMEYVDN